MVKKDDFLTRVTEIGTCEDDVQRRTLLATLQNEVSEVFDAHETLTTTNATLTKANEDLRAANMDLFLQIGQKKKPEEIKEDNTGLEDNKPPKKREYKDLFDEKGGLK